MAECMTRRFWDLNVRMGREGCEALECFLEKTIQHDLLRNQKISPDKAQEIESQSPAGRQDHRRVLEGADRGRPSDHGQGPVYSVEKMAAEVSGRPNSRTRGWIAGLAGKSKRRKAFLTVLMAISAWGEEEGKSQEYSRAERGVPLGDQLDGPRRMATVSRPHDHDLPIR